MSTTFETYSGQDISLKATAALSTAYVFVVMDANGEIAAATASNTTPAVYGILQEAVEAGAQARVRVNGCSYLRAGSGLDAAASVGAGAAGVGIVAASGKPELAVTLKLAAGAGDLVPVVLTTEWKKN